MNEASRRGRWGPENKLTRNDASEASIKGHPATWEEALDLAWARCREIMVARHQKYGNGNIARLMDRGVVVRLGDKVERLMHAYFESGRTFTEPTSSSEDLDTIEDAWVDTANYAVIALMCRAGHWRLPARCLGEVPTVEEVPQ